MGRNNKDFFSDIKAKHPFDRTREETDALKEHTMITEQEANEIEHSFARAEQEMGK